jgi:regulation of enolase protein 1 (concanavalin A-like superfamily)
MRQTLLLACLFYCVHVFAQNDSIKINSLPRAMGWENKPTKPVVVTSNNITIIADKETDQYTDADGYYSNSAPKLLFAPDENFTFSVKIKLGFDSVYEGGALVIYTDSLNWVKLLFERADEKSIMVSSSVVKNKVSDDNYHNIIKGKEVYLKISKANKTYCLYYSLDGKQWNVVRSFTYDKTSAMRLGISAQSPKGPSTTVVFSDIKYKPVGFTNYFTGE